MPDKKLTWKEAWKQIWVPDWKEIWLPAWKKIWKPVWISEWFPSPDHHDHHHHHHEEHGWADRKDNNAAGSNNKFVFKRSEQDTAQPGANVQSNTKSLVQSPVYFPTPLPQDTTARSVVGKT